MNSLAYRTILYYIFVYTRRTTSDATIFIYRLGRSRPAAQHPTVQHSATKHIYIL